MALKLTQETVEQKAKYVKKKETRVTSTVCSCQLSSFWCLFLVILDIFHTVF